MTMREADRADDFIISNINVLKCGVGNRSAFRLNRVWNYIEWHAILLVLL